MAAKTGRLRKRKIGGCRRQCRGDGRLLPHPGHHAGLQDRLQPDVAGRRSMERLHLRAQGHHDGHQRRHHLQGDPFDREEAQILPRHQDTPCHPADSMGTDHGIHRHPCGRCADTRPEPVGRGKGQASERPYRGDSEGIPLLQDYYRICQHAADGRHAYGRCVPPAMVERPP